MPSVQTADGPAVVVAEAPGEVQLFPLGVSETVVVALSANMKRVGVVEARFIVMLYPVELLVLTVKTLEVDTGVPGVTAPTNETLSVSIVKVKETPAGVKVPMLAPAS